MTTTTPKPKQAPYHFACACGHGQSGIATEKERAGIWIRFCWRHRKIECDPRIDPQHERAEQ
jgi:hypothetical protein